MIERYNLPKNEQVLRRSPENWKDFLVKYLPGGESVDLQQSFTVSEDSDLGYRHFAQGQGRNVSFELLISNEASDLLQESGKVETKHRLKQAIHQIIEQPYGSRSIDPHHSRKKGKKGRSVNLLSAELERKLNLPLAIKGSAQFSPGHPGRENLINQFIYMRKLQKEWEQLPEYIRNILHICKVYAVIRHAVNDKRKTQDWLIMERVPNAQSAEDGGSIIEDRKEFGFVADQHPRLEEVINKEINDPFLKRKVRSPYTDNICYKWQTLKQALEKAKLHLSDLSGRNVLYTSAVPSERQYIIIDQGGR